MGKGVLRQSERDAFWRHADMAGVLGDAENEYEPHPDVAENQSLYGCAHTHGGRWMPKAHHIGATLAEQESRLKDPAGWNHHVNIAPVDHAVQGARAYNSLMGLQDPHTFDYSKVRQDPSTVATVGRIYDKMPAFDSNATKHWDAMRNEVGKQYDFMTKKLGINVEPVHYDPYPDVHHMANDVANNKRLRVLSTAATGSHPYFSDADNDKFRAVHDYFGHAATGSSFDRHGEQAAYLAHSQMFTPHARPAMATETKGQNTSLILNGHFGPQKIGLLPQQHWDNSSLIKPEGLKAASIPGGTHLPVSELKGYMNYLGGSSLTDPAYSSFPDLTNHIQQHGIQSPIWIKTDGQHAYIQDGKHRIRAAEQLGMDTAPVTVERVPSVSQKWMKNPVGSGLGGMLNKTAAISATNRYILLPHWDPESAAQILYDHAADMVGHTKMAVPQATPELMDMAHKGGFTLHDHVGDAPTKGYMVSLAKNTEQMIPIKNLTPKHISDFVAKHNHLLTKPDAYLGGWLDGHNFYLDISHHRPQLDNAAHDAYGANQLAVYDLDKGQAINTPEAHWQSGQAYPLPAPGKTASHDWTQHTLGDAEHWGWEKTASEISDNMDISHMSPTGQELGTHGAQVFHDQAKNQKWLVKPAPKSGKFLAPLDVGANKIAQMSGLETPPTFLTQHNGKPASVQQMYNAVDAFPDKTVNPEKVNDEDLLEIQKHHALDWALSNHDSHPGQFIRSQGDEGVPAGKLVGIDKGQAFKYFNNDKLHWNFHPNGQFYGETEPIYNTMYRNMAKGGRMMHDPREGDLGKYVQGLQNMPDEQYVQAIQPYAEQAAKAGLLGAEMPEYEHFGESKFQPNDVQGFIKAALERKHNLMNDLGELHDRAMAHRMTGEKIAKNQAKYVPNQDLMENVYRRLGSHGARVYSDPKGEWLIKQPLPGRNQEFMVPLDEATTKIQHRVGLPAPEAYTIDWNGAPARAIHMIPGAQQAWEDPPRLQNTDPADILELQKHQAMDWMIANHDAHVGNFMRTPDGHLVGIDKGQSAKYLGRDRLDPTFHPNFYAREPVYNQLWRDYAEGAPGEMNDPRQGELGQFVDQLQEISDSELKNLFRDYADAAAGANQLVRIPDEDERRKLDKPSLPPNDPEVFLEALAKRKNHLRDDLGALFDNMTKQRQGG